MKPEFIQMIIILLVIIYVRMDIKDIEQGYQNVNYRSKKAFFKEKIYLVQ